MNKSFNHLAEQPTAENQIPTTMVNNNAHKDIAVSEMRGAIIHAMVILELIIDKIILFHFFDNEIKRKEFLHVILSKEQMGLSIKVDVLFFIIKAYHPNFFEVNKNLSRKYFSTLIDLRNDMAHRKFFSGDSETDETYFLDKFTVDKGKIDSTQVEISYEIAYKNAEEIITLSNKLEDLFFEKNP